MCNTISSAQMLQDRHCGKSKHNTEAMTSPTELFKQKKKLNIVLK